MSRDIENTISSEDILKLRMFAFEQAAVIARFNDKEARYKKVNPTKVEPVYDEIYTCANDIIHFCLKGEL